jgi:hypothetical protein
MMGKPRTSRRYNRNNEESDESTDSSDDEEGNSNKKVFLPSSFHGSPRHRKKLAHNALEVVTRRGAHTLFITGTTNVNWPEIVSQLLPGQTAFDRPDIVTQVFHARVKKLIHNLKHGKQHIFICSIFFSSPFYNTFSFTNFVRQVLWRKESNYNDLRF